MDTNTQDRFVWIFDGSVNEQNELKINPRLTKKIVIGHLGY